MREKTIEAKLVQAVRTKGGLAPKFTSPGLDGVPDRLVLLPGGRIAFIELKANTPPSASKAKKAVRSTRLFGVLHR